MCLLGMLPTTMLHYVSPVHSIQNFKPTIAHTILMTDAGQLQFISHEKSHIHL